MKSKRFFLEGAKHSDSYVRVTVEDNGYVTIKLSDCDRRIEWYFGVPKDKRAVNKIKKVKKIIDQVHKHLTGE